MVAELRLKSSPENTSCTGHAWNFFYTIAIPSSSDHELRRRGQTFSSLQGNLSIRTKSTHNIDSYTNIRTSTSPREHLVVRIFFGCDVTAAYSHSTRSAPLTWRHGCGNRAKLFPTTSFKWSCRLFWRIAFIRGEHARIGRPALGG